jgi:hypothetical protein
MKNTQKNFSVYCERNISEIFKSAVCFYKKNTAFGKPKHGKKPFLFVLAQKLILLRRVIM